MANLLFNRLEKMTKPKILFFSEGRRYEGIVLSMDDEFLELYDPIRNYRRFFRLSKIDDLEIREEQND